MTLPWTTLSTAVQIPMTMTSSVVPNATAMRKPIMLVTNWPMYGMNPPKNERIATGSANGRPRRVMMMNPVTALNMARTPVAIM